MPKPTHVQIEKLLKTLVLPFYHIKRDTPLPIGDRREENDAEHSWSLALLACSIAPEINIALDTGKICQFAIVHDLVEVYADDTSVFADDAHLSTKAKREAHAFAVIAEEFAYLPWIAKTIEEYERKDTDEAKFVYALDKYIAIFFDYIDQGRLFRQRKVTLAEYNKSLTAHRQKARSHPDIAEYYEEIRAMLDAHPEYFHQEKIK